MFTEKRWIKVAILVIILVALFMAAVAEAGESARAWFCSQSQICPVVMHGQEGHESRLHVRCWDEYGSGDVALQRVGGNDYFVRCE